MRQRTLAFALMLLAALLCGPTGCGKKERERAAAEAKAKADADREAAAKHQVVIPPPKEQPGDIAKAPSKPPIRGGSVQRAVNRSEVENMLKNLNLATVSFVLEHKRYPGSREELEGYYEKNVSINEALKEGDIVYVWKGRKHQPSEKFVLAYEGQPDTLGRRVVLMTDGEIMTVSDGPFQEMAKLPTK
jgi:hypothetical protein